VTRSLFEENKTKTPKQLPPSFEAFSKQPNSGEEEIKESPSSKWERIRRELLGGIYIHANRLHHCSTQLKRQPKLIKKRTLLLRKT